MFLRSALALVIILVVAFTSTRFPAAQTATVSGTATLTGAVESATPYTGAQVFIRNVDKRILYMVYTNAKRFRAVALFPGNYEISARDQGPQVRRAEARRQSRRQPEGDADVRAARRRRAIARSSTRNESESQGDRTVTHEASYDEIYPPGPGRDIAERTCMICHGENFLSTQPATVGTWNLRLDRMMGKNLFDKTAGIVRRRAPDVPRVGAALLARGSRDAGAVSGQELRARRRSRARCGRQGDAARRSEARARRCSSSTT